MKYTTKREPTTTTTKASLRRHCAALFVVGWPSSSWASLRRRWAAFIVRHSALRSGPSHHVWALRIAFGPSTSRLGPPHRVCALHIAFVPSTSRLGPPHRVWALHIAFGPSASRLCPPCRVCALHIVFGPSACCHTRRVEEAGRSTSGSLLHAREVEEGVFDLRLALAREGVRRGVGYAGGRRCVGKRGGQWGYGSENDENGPRVSSWPVFVTHCLGLPLPGSPLVILPPISLRRAQMSRPTSLERGGAR